MKTATTKTSALVQIGVPKCTRNALPQVSNKTKKVKSKIADTLKHWALSPLQNQASSHTSLCWNLSTKIMNFACWTFIQGWARGYGLVKTLWVSLLSKGHYDLVAWEISNLRIDNKSDMSNITFSYPNTNTQYFQRGLNNTQYQYQFLKRP